MYSLSMSEARALQASASAPEDEEEKPDVPTLMQHMRDSGLVMKPGAMPLAAGKIVDNDTSLTETDLISQLTKKQKKKLLKLAIICFMIIIYSITGYNSLLYLCTNQLVFCVFWLGV